MRHWLGSRTYHLAVAREGHLYDALKATACLLSFMFFLPWASPFLSYKVCFRGHQLAEVDLVLGTQVSHYAEPGDLILTTSSSPSPVVLNKALPGADQAGLDWSFLPSLNSISVGLAWISRASQ